MHYKYIFRIVITLLLFLSFTFVSTLSKAQNLDLIITNIGDSIACRIDSVTPSHIYFEMKYNYNWGSADLETEEYIDHQFKVINIDYVKYKEGTSFIIGYEDRSTSMVNDVYVPQKYRQEEAEQIIAEKPKALNKNCIYTNIGSLIFISNISINYERILFGGDGKRSVTFLGRIGYGGIYITDGLSEAAGSYTILSAVILTGKNSGHFEGSIGYALLQSDVSTGDLQFSAGFRYQAPGKTFMYKVGGGSPEIVYFGIGATF